MSSDDDEYMGQGSISEAYSNMHKERRKEIKKIFPMWNVRDLVRAIAEKDREMAPLRRQIREMEIEQSELIERVRRIMIDDR